MSIAFGDNLVVALISRVAASSCGRICSVLVVVGTMLSIGCDAVGPQAPSTPASEEIDFGTFKDSVYRNKYFGLTIKLPSGWSVQDRDAQKRLQDIGSKMMTAHDKNLEAVVKASELQTVTLLMAFEHPLGSPVAYNPNFTCMAEQIRHIPGIKSGKDYIFHLRKALESGALEASFPEEVTTETIGDADFDTIAVEMMINGMAVRQRYYVTVMKGYALVISVAYTTEEEKAALESIVETITLT